MSKIKVGAVVYAPQVTVILGIIADYFKEAGMEIETVFFKDYRSQDKALLDGEVDIIWNSPLAFVECDIKSNSKATYSYMRDTDQDRTSCFLTKKDSGIKTTEDLRGKTIGFGAVDSPQARLIPIQHLRENGLEYNKDYKEVTFDVALGLDGDHEGGEYDALEALRRGEVDACVTTDNNRRSWELSGKLDPNQIIVCSTTGLYDHCIFSVREGFPKDLLEKWEQILSAMDYNNPKHKEMMDMEGLKKWVPGRRSGFTLLEKAVDYLKYFD